MKTTSRLAVLTLLALVAVLCLAGSQLKLAPGFAVVQAAGQVDQGPDPADVNQAQAPAGQSYTTEAPPPDQNPDDAGYAEQPTATATEPPPALPVYVQPPCPNDGYIWTPGYWAWGPYGYYWVPGVWVEPPYVGALWTPGYWGFFGGRYMWYPGHWGFHIGWYGGINYGFGYVGVGYFGGYWNSGHFFYNRVFNRVDERVVHNVYTYHSNVRVNNVHIDNNVRVNNEHINNNVHVNNEVRPSYHGGTSGVQSHPQPSEAAAYHEPTAPTMSTQQQHEQNYSAQRGQYASQNSGRPATTTESRPLHADPNVRPQQRSGGGGGEHHR